MARYTLPAGTYWLGDPCYSLTREQMDAWVTAAWANTDGLLVAPVDGLDVVGLLTLYGDGSYRGSDGFDYPVDAGMIGLVPEEVATPAPARLRTKVTFGEPVEVSRDEDGVLTFGNIEIYTFCEPRYFDDDSDFDEYLAAIFDEMENDNEGI